MVLHTQSTIIYIEEQESPGQVGAANSCQRETLARATKWSPVIINQGEGEFCEEILTHNLHFNGLIETQYLKARFFH